MRHLRSFVSLFRFAASTLALPFAAWGQTEHEADAQSLIRCLNDGLAFDEFLFCPPKDGMLEFRTGVSSSLASGVSGIEVDLYVYVRGRVPAVASARLSSLGTINGGLMPGESMEVFGTMFLDQRTLDLFVDRWFFVDYQVRDVADDRGRGVVSDLPNPFGWHEAESDFVCEAEE